MAITEEFLYSNKRQTNTSQLELLKKHFPQCFDKNGGFIQEKFIEYINGSGNELSNESYSLNWLGKSYARLLTSLPPETLLNQDIKHNSTEQNHLSSNLLIKGDNLEVLKHMVNAYAEKVSMIYIDPPYNTGVDGFVYKDDRKFSSEELSNIAGISIEESEKILKYLDKGSNSHSAWLTFMYPRLYFARLLLSEDGVIYISIDDNEVAQLKILCDEVFGEQNFAAMIPWKKRTAKSDVPFGISQDCEWILCYAKKDFNAGLVNQRKYHWTEDYPDDRWRTADLTKQTSSDDRENSAFDMVNPKTGEVYPYDPNRVWMVSKDTFQQYYDKGRIIFPGDYEFLNISGPVSRVFESEDKKKALAKYGTEQSFKAVSTNLPKEVGMTSDGNKDILKLFDKKVFSFPKPVSLIKHLIRSINDRNAIVLDFFSGSGTTAQAVMELNEEDDGKRQFICVQVDEKTDPKREAYKSGYKTVFEITKERILRASKKIIEHSEKKPSEFGFKIFETVNEFRKIPDLASSFSEKNSSFLNDFALTEHEYNTLLTTWCIYDGSVLTTPVKNVILAEYTAHLCDRRLYLIANNFSTQALKSMLEMLDQDKTFAPNKVIFYGHNFDSAMQMQLKEALNSYSNNKSLDIDIVARY